MPADARVLSRWFGRLKGERTTMNSEWEEIAQYEFPERYGFLYTSFIEGQKRTTKLTSPIGPYNVEGLATNLEGICFPHEQRWFSLKPEDMDEDEVPEEIETQLERVTDAVWDDFYNPASGGSTSLSSILMDAVAFGPMMAIVYARPQGNPDFTIRAPDLRSTWIDTDREGNALAMFLQDDLTAIQVRDAFPQATMPPSIQEVLDREDAPTDTRKFIIVSAFHKRSVFNRMSDLATEKEWAYVVFCDGDKEVIEEGGFDEQPFVFGRYRKVIGEKYSWSPGRLALPDIKSFNTQMQSLLTGSALSALKPFAYPDDGSFNIARLAPGTAVPYSTESAAAVGGRVPIQPLDMTGNSSDGWQGLEVLQKHIEAVFKKDLFSMPIEGPQMTATEVIARKQQFVQQLGPVYANLLLFVKPLIERCAAIKIKAMTRRQEDKNQKEARAKGFKGQLPQPQGVSMVGTRLDFVSPVQKAIDEIRAMKAAKGFAAMQPAIALDAGAADNFDYDKIVRDTADYSDFNADWTRPLDEVEALRQQRAKAQAAQAAGQQALDAAKVAPGVEKAAPGTMSRLIPQLLQGQGLGVPTPPTPLGGIPEAA